MSQANPLPPLTPVRYRPGLFSIDVSSIGIKDAQQHLEYPFFVLSKTPSVEERHYEDRHGNTLTVRPTTSGLPTIWDKDLLIFAISQIVERRSRGEEVSPTVRFHTADVLEFLHRTKGGNDYARIDNSLRRLAGCTLETNIRTGGELTTKLFHIIDEATIKRQYDQPHGRLQYCEFTLSDWLWRALQANEILTLHPDYFRLRQALARRIYEIARKHCGRQAQWEIELSLLHHKTGARMSLRHFRGQVKRLSTHGDLLDYDMELLPRGDREIIRFRRREGSLVDAMGGIDSVQLSETVIPAARKVIGTAGSVDQAEKDWRRWMLQKGFRPTNAEALFLSFCRRWAQCRGLPEGGMGPDNRPSFRDELTEAWWAGLDENARQRWRDGVGLRVELADGTGWWRSEESLARKAFDRLYPFQGTDPAYAEFPPVLLERLSRELEGCGVMAEDLSAAWRGHAGTDPVLNRIQDPLMSLWLFARDVRNGKPAAMQAVRAARNQESAAGGPSEKAQESLEGRDGGTVRPAGRNDQAPGPPPDENRHARFRAWVAEAVRYCDNYPEEVLFGEEKRYEDDLRRMTDADRVTPEQYLAACSYAEASRTGMSDDARDPPFYPPWLERFSDAYRIRLWRRQARERAARAETAQDSHSGS